MRSPFRRRRKRPRKRSAPAPEPEVIDWPKDGTGGRGGLMAAIRGDSESGAGVGFGVVADLQIAFGGSGKQIQLQEEDAEKMRRHELKTEGSPNRDDLESGTIRITKPRGEDNPPEA